jgi:hypothetical protein
MFPLMNVMFGINRRIPVFSRPFSTANPENRVFFSKALRGSALGGARKNAFQTCHAGRAGAQPYPPLARIRFPDVPRHYADTPLRRHLP